IMRLPARLLHRKLRAHKGDFGHILILAGCAQFSGAAILCSNAAMASGAGLVTLGLPRSLCNAFIKIKSPEVMLKPLAQTPEATLSIKALGRINAFLNKVDILVIGPGLSQDKSTQSLIRNVIKAVDKPLVIDADGINALCGHLQLIKNSKSKAAILTPHVGEMARLIGDSKSKIQSCRKEIARGFSKNFGITLVLKGRHTIVADYQRNLYINKTGNPGMATAGSGDVLTGIIAAFLAQGLDAFNAAKYAVYLHGLAGDLAAKEKTQIGMIASDIITKLPEAIKLSL
ncbi:MAG: NAD(P)H-hydrate dehydratase, partial [Candidatus Omnitrophota bacterium]